MKTIAINEFVKLLGHSTDLTATGVRLANQGLELALAVDGRSISARIQGDGVKLKNKDFEIISKLATPHAKGEQKSKRPKTIEDPTLQDLIDHGLPLYWNREWLAEKVKELGSYAKVARMYSKEVGGVNATTIANYAREKFGWKPRGEIKRKRHQVIDEYDKLNGEITQPALASKYNVAVSTVNRWLAEARDSYKQLTENRRNYISDEARERFAEENNLSRAIVFRWLDEGSEIFASDKNTQPKKRYHRREEYDKIRDEVREYFWLNDGDVNISELARRYDVDRSTITAWTRDLEVIPS